ncbi:MAG: replication protein RepA [Pseudomonadota bacterium]|nr:replication protein RepA [Pseudomonadota bacterium]
MTGKTDIDRIVAEALAIEAESAKEAGALGFMARVMVQATMPHKRPDTTIFDRRNGNFHLSLSAANPKIGLPYGSIPRLLLAWLTTETVRTRERELVLGDSLSDFMRQLGMVPTGGRWGSITRLKNQTKCLFSCHISAYYDTDETYRIANFPVARRASLWWNSKSPEQKSLWKSTVLLDEEFYQELIERPVPVDMRALQALKQSPMALDIYCWLTYRLSYLRKPTDIPWEALQVQFGADYPQTGQGKRDFKKKFLKHLKKTNVIYPGAKVSEGKIGLALKPSKTHVQRLK